ncbi:hypothetical protein OG426_12785 [Streptomyces canus]|uniref:hypothetical protein n=1 Tax=Streptomyces canus TaxID=58343 RepID=UPI0038700406|nr:hypothetical protein OG426_12785 [Streptomyces canus]
MPSPSATASPAVVLPRRFRLLRWLAVVVASRRRGLLRCWLPSIRRTASVRPGPARRRSAAPPPLSQASAAHPLHRPPGVRPSPRDFDLVE